MRRGRSARGGDAAGKFASWMMHADGSPNQYSSRWFSTFLGQIDAGIVRREVEFLERVLPRAQVGRGLDLCCGVGRHAIPLARAGYRVLAIDRDLDALAAIDGRGEPHAHGRLELVVGDMRAVPVLSSSVDAIICMWQSFGYFDSATNLAVLADCARALCAGGRLMVDLYHRGYYQQMTGQRRVVRNGVSVTEDRAIVDNRLRMTLRYSDAAAIDGDSLGEDAFDWQLYTPDEIAADAAAVGLDLKLACTEFDESRPVTSASPRMQLLFTRH